MVEGSKGGGIDIEVEEMEECTDGRKRWKRKYKLNWNVKQLR